MNKPKHPDFNWYSSSVKNKKKKACSIGSREKSPLAHEVAGTLLIGRKKQYAYFGAFLNR
jgi:hypothetical protein